MLSRLANLPPAYVRVIIASLIAATSLLGAVAAWRASVASSESGDLDRKGFADSVADAEQRARIRADLARVLFDYVRSRAYSAQAQQLRKEARAATPDDAYHLRTDAKVSEGLVKVARDQIEADALKPNGTLDLRRKFDIEYELAKSENDLDPAAEFARSDRLGTKSERLVGLTALLIAAAFFFTLAQITKRRVYLVYLGSGVVVLAVAAALLVAVEATA